jgi:hypothetical protein
MAEKQLSENQIKGLIGEAIKVAMAEAEAKFGKMIAEAIVGLANKEETAAVILKIVDGQKNFVSTDVLEERLTDLITKDQWNEALEGMLSTAVPLTGIRPELAAAEIQSDPIPVEYLDGLVFRSSKPKKTDTGKANIPTERPLTTDDVLSWKDNGETVTIITADGQKYTVDKE